MTHLNLTSIAIRIADTLLQKEYFTNLLEYVRTEPENSNRYNRTYEIRRCNLAIHKLDKELKVLLSSYSTEKERQKELNNFGT